MMLILVMLLVMWLVLKLMLMLVVVMVDFGNWTVTDAMISSLKSL